MTDAGEITHAPANPIRGVFWMLVTGFCFVTVTAIVKYTGDRIPAAESAFLRYFMGLIFLLPVIRPLVRARLTGRQWTLFAFRGACHAAGVILWFFAMTQIPIAEVTAMNYMAPVYVTIGAVFLLGERLAARRICAIIAALVGTAIILRPGFREIEDGHLAMLLCAVIFAAGYLAAKILADEVPASVVVAMLSVFVTLFLAPAALAVWITPTWGELGLLFAVACFATVGHYTMTLAFAAAPVSVTQPVTFLQLVWATALGALAFAEPVDIWVVLGGTLIVSAVSFITWREAVLRRRSITPPSPATKF